ncbi:hypothetical protein [Natronorubrum sp. DTA28]|uniref:hypothetical protein n=1 Tax=Natronorubrum sp. DTA28 TaxID=3447019 RepID=UPI003F84CD2A
MPDVLAGEQLVATVVELTAGRTDLDALERAQLEYFQTLDRYGLATRTDRVWASSRRNRGPRKC